MELQSKSNTPRGLGTEPRDEVTKSTWALPRPSCTIPLTFTALQLYDKTDVKTNWLEATASAHRLSNETARECVRTKRGAVSGLGGDAPAAPAGAIPAVAAHSACSVLVDDKYRSPAITDVSDKRPQNHHHITQSYPARGQTTS